MPSSGVMTVVVNVGTEGGFIRREVELLKEEERKKGRAREGREEWRWASTYTIIWALFGACSSGVSEESTMLLH